MKKTMTVNLNGIVFHIDEDAYQTLNQYLEDLGRHFKAEERDEILRDIEARIAELFTEKLVDRHVVEMADVQDVMKTMGQPNQFGDEEAQTESAETKSSAQPQQQTTRRKLYRDIDNKRIGGVAAGIAAYLDWDVLMVRILMILLLLLSIGWVLFIYILMWIFVPEARSVAQRLEMQGVAPTVENIKDYDAHRDSTPSRSSDTFSKVLKVIAIVILSCLALGLFAAVAGVLIALFLFLFNVLPGFTNPMNWYDVMLMTSVALFLLCPAIAIVMFCSYVLSSRRPRYKATAWVLLSVWFLSLIGMITTGCLVAKNRMTSGLFSHSVTQELFGDDDDDTFFTERTVDGEDVVHGIEAEGGMEIRYTQGDTLAVQVKAPKGKEQNVITRVRNGILHIENDNRNNLRGPIVVEVTAPALNAITLKEACVFKSNSPMTAKCLDVELEEACQISLSGNVDTLSVKVEEASKADLEELNADVAQVRASEASKVQLGKARELCIHSTDASKVTYKGQPERLQSSSSSSFMTHFSD